MSGVLASQRVASQLRYLPQILERFEQFHAANSRVLIREFCDFFTQDDVLGIVAGALFDRVPFSPQDWHDQVQSSGSVAPLPDDPLGAFAFRWGCLRLVRRGKIDLRYFVANHFKGSHLNEMMMNWKRLIVHPFAADCRALADDLLAQLGDDEWTRFHDVVSNYLDGPFAQRGFGPRSWNDDDDVAAEDGTARPSPTPASRPTQTRPPATAPDLETALEALGDAVRSAGAASDVLKDVEALRLESQRPTPEPSRMLARLTGMAEACAGLENACCSVEQAILKRS